MKFVSIFIVGKIFKVNKKLRSVIFMNYFIFYKVLVFCCLLNRWDIDFKMFNLKFIELIFFLLLDRYIFF